MFYCLLAMLMTLNIDYDDMKVALWTFFSIYGASAVSQRWNGASACQAWILCCDCVTNCHCDFAIFARADVRCIWRWVRSPH